MHPHTPAVRRFADSQIRRFADSTTPPLARIITFPPMEHFTASVHVSEPTIIVRLMNALACVENLLCSLVCSSFSRILSQNSAQSQLLLWDCFADSLFLTELQNGSRSLIQFYFIISQARSTAACTDQKVSATVMDVTSHFGVFTQTSNWLQSRVQYSYSNHPLEQ
jgi:hypothetical protein